MTDQQSDRQEASPSVSVTENGPYMVEGISELIDARGEDVSKDGKVFLCRCGQSSNKPFCDGTHKKVGFDGSERHRWDMARRMAARPSRRRSRSENTEHTLGP